MNEHDLLDSIGGIDPKYINDADKAVTKHHKISHLGSYDLAAAGLLLLVVAGIVIRYNRMAPAYESINETGEVTMLRAVPEETEEAVPELTEVTEDNKEIATEESLETESADSDYPAMVMYEGAVYKDSGQEFIGEIYEDGLLQVSSYTDDEPLENGQQNFDRSSETKFFVLNEDAIVVCIDPNEGIWRVFFKQ